MSYMRITGHDAMLFAGLAREEAELSADEQRDAEIEAMVPELAAHLESDSDFCEMAMSELCGDPLNEIAKACGSFYARYKAAETERGEAEAGYALYRLVKPYIKTAAKDQAESDARDKVGKA